MTIPSHLADFWQAFVASVPGADAARFHEAFAFGDSPELADELAALVLSGRKRATAAAVWTFEARGKPLPVPGDLSIVTSGDDRPLCVIRTQRVEVLPFHAVTAEFAAIEGEGHGSLTYWRDAHRRFFGRECAAAGREFSEDMPVACERFELIYRTLG